MDPTKNVSMRTHNLPRHGNERMRERGGLAALLGRERGDPAEDVWTNGRAPF